MNRKPEVLAPAGSAESLQAAVRAGADAVYLGARRFSARAGASNFAPDELKTAVEYCHARDVKVYLAINTVLFDDELDDALALVREACALPVDALLVQDMGLVRFLARKVPQLKLHASTQTSVHTAAGVRALEKAGFRRVVLARELSLKEIESIHRECPGMELETFVHGALCMSVSGQCYFSAVLGSRSGNRGLCAQPCRLPFSVPGGTGHDLSLKDLSLIPRAAELARAGSSSLKIEGRLKRPEYVAAATRACRYAADGKSVPNELLNDLRAVFSRSGFTSGYADGERGRRMFGIRSREDVAGATAEVLRSLRSIYAREDPKFPVDFALEITYNKPIKILVSDMAGHGAEVEGAVPQKALNRPVSRERCEEQLGKTGGTPFFAREIHCKIDEGLAVPVSELNRLRREALSLLERQRAAKPAVPFSDGAVSRPEPHAAGEFRLRAFFADGCPPEAAKRCELVYVPCAADPHRLEFLLKNGFPIGVEIPRGLFGIEDAVRRQLEMARAAGVADVWAGNLDGARLGLDVGMRVHGGFSMNITNAESLEWYREFGLADAELSPELKLSQALHLGGAMPRGLLIYGRLPLMLCRNCPAANSERGCLRCRTAPELTDRRGIKFPVQCRGACSEVLNSVPLYLADRMGELENLDFGFLRFTTENPKDEEKILREYFEAASGQSLSRSQEAFTRGLYYRGIL